MTEQGTCFSLACLDDNATVAAVTNLQQKGIKTIVIGFGAEAGVGGPVLSAMANAGGMAGVCGGSTAYCQADNAAGLQAILGKLGGIFQNCNWSVAGTFDPATLVVQVVPDNDPGGATTLVSGTDYTFAPGAGGGTVTVKDPWCTTLKNSTDQYTIEFSYAEAI